MTTANGQQDLGDGPVGGDAAAPSLGRCYARQGLLCFGLQVVCRGQEASLTEREREREREENDFLSQTLCWECWDFGLCSCCQGVSFSRGLGGFAESAWTHELRSEFSLFTT